jgi:hypothetical protein
MAFGNEDGHRTDKDNGVNRMMDPLIHAHGFSNRLNKGVVVVVVVGGGRKVGKVDLSMVGVPSFCVQEEDEG